MTNSMANARPNPVAVQLSIGRALLYAGTFAFSVAAVTNVPRMLRRGDFSRLPHVLVFLLLFSCLLAWPVREMFKVWISSDGIGSRRRPILWNEVTEIERRRGALSGWNVCSTYKPGVTVLTSVAKLPEFRSAIERFAPPGNPVRELLGESEK